MRCHCKGILVRTLRTVIGDFDVYSDQFLLFHWLSILYVCMELLLVMCFHFMISFRGFRHLHK